MGWPFLYFSDDGLSLAELTAARLDGDLVDVGEAYMPADAVETPALRAASLGRLVPTTVALTRASAAWVHGAVGAPPVRHSVQRLAGVRIHVHEPRLQYRDGPVPRDHVVVIGGVAVTSPARTLADLTRDLCGGDVAAESLVEAMTSWHPALVATTSSWLQKAPPMHFKRAALVYLRARAARAEAQDDVTR